MNNIYEVTLDHLHEIVDQIHVDSYQGNFSELYSLIGCTLAICECVYGKDHVLNVMSKWIEEEKNA